MFVGGCVALIGGAAESIEDESERIVNVTYEITGGGPTCSVICTNGDINTSTDNDILVPWKKDVEITGFVKFMSLADRHHSVDSSETITCIRYGHKIPSESSPVRKATTGKPKPG